MPTGRYQIDHVPPGTYTLVAWVEGDDSRDPQRPGHRGGAWRRAGLPASMTLLASLTNRIFIAASLLAIVTTGVAVYVVGAAGDARGGGGAGARAGRGRRTGGPAAAGADGAVAADRAAARRPAEAEGRRRDAPCRDRRAHRRRLPAPGRRRPAGDLRPPGRVLAAVPSGAGGPTPTAVACGAGRPRGRRVPAGPARRAAGRDRADRHRPRKPGRARHAERRRAAGRADGRPLQARDAQRGGVHAGRRRARRDAAAVDLALPCSRC